jgi:hypothetical protein
MVIPVRTEKGREYMRRVRLADKYVKMMEKDLGPRKPITERTGFDDWDRLFAMIERIADVSVPGQSHEYDPCE